MMFVADHKALRYFLTLENSTKIEKEGLCSCNDEGTICDSAQLLKPLISLVLHHTQLQLTTPENTVTHHNTFCLSSQNFA